MPAFAPVTIQYSSVIIFLIDHVCFPRCSDVLVDCVCQGRRKAAGTVVTAPAEATALAAAAAGGAPEFVSVICGPCCCVQLSEGG